MNARMRKMGSTLGTLDDGAYFDMADTVEALISMSTIPRDAWRDFLFVFAVNEAHDQGVERAEVERAVADIVAEEWSTPNTAGRAARRRN